MSSEPRGFPCSDDIHRDIADRAVAAYRADLIAELHRRWPGEGRSVQLIQIVRFLTDGAEPPEQFTEYGDRTPKGIGGRIAARREKP